MTIEECMKKATERFENREVESVRVSFICFRKNELKATGLDDSSAMKQASEEFDRRKPQLTSIEDYYLKRLEEAIRKFIEMSFTNPFRILSESDMKCWLFHFLQDGKEYNINDTQKTYYLHSETNLGGNSWVDLYIFSAEFDFKRNDSSGCLRKWSFKDTLFDIGIELKYNYNENKDDFTKKINDDMNKFLNSEIKHRFSVIFDHRGCLESEDDFLSNTEKSVKTIYIDARRKKVLSNFNFVSS